MPPSAAFFAGADILTVSLFELSFAEIEKFLH